MSDQDSQTCVVEPDYFQFYARLAGAELASDQVSPAGYRDRLWTNGQFVYIGTSRKFGAMTLTVEVQQHRAPSPGADWQHVAEVSLGSGHRLEVLSWDSDVPAMTCDLPLRAFRLRVLWQGLVQGRFEGLDENFESDERVLIQMWPAAEAPSQVLRRWNGWPSSP